MIDLCEQDVGRILIGESKVIRDVRREIARYGPTRLPILIQGPTGSGKELAARAVHGVSRRDGALVAFNVCALGDGMFEDALFGHVRGAFTGAVGDASGYLAEANGGTVFLDEISGLSMSSQAKLLRALETGVYRPLGAGRDRMSDFRLLSASNEDLAELSRRRTFREDLLHRIGGCVITLPSLHERRDDIPVLVRHFLADLSRGQTVATPALDRLQSHHWQGNVRELRHVVDRLLVIAEGEEIVSSHVNAVLRSTPAADTPLDPDAAFRTKLLEVLDAAGGNTAIAATILNVHRATIYRWMRRLQLADAPSVSSGGVVLAPGRPQPRVS